MIRLLAIFALFLFCAFSCSKDEEEANPVEENPAPITMVEMPETAVVGQTVSATVYFTVNNGCGQFGAFDVDESQMMYTIKVLPKYIGEACTLDIPTRKVTYSFKPDKAGIYTLKFWSIGAGGEEYITKTVHVSGTGV